MLEHILQKDRELLIFLNNLGTEHWDGFWLFITNQLNWTPLFVLILYLVFKNFGLKKGLFIVFFISLTIAFSDQITNLVKNSVGRVRPCNVEDLQVYLRQFTYKSGGKSFWSGHACTSMTFTMLMVFMFKNKYKFIYLLFLFPLFFGFSRIYLRVHYPLDVFTGYVSGFLIGTTFYCLLKYIFNKVSKEKITDVIV